MDKSGAKFKFVGHSTEIIRQSKIKGPLHASIQLLITKDILFQDSGRLGRGAGYGTPIYERRNVVEPPKQKEESALDLLDFDARVYSGKFQSKSIRDLP